MATNYDVNYDDERFTKVESEKSEALDDLDKTYDGLVNKSDKYFKDQINASKEWAETQKQNQQAQTDFAIEKIEQQKDQAHKDYIKEQSGAYVDWQEQSAQHGVNAEQQAAIGMQNSGYSESSKVSMYNTYQNRVTAAKESYNRAVLNYDNAIKDAMLQNNSVLAEIAYNALQKQLELSLQGFQYKNSLILEKSNKKLEVDNMYYNRWKDVLNQINTENALAEEVRQYDETLAFQKDSAAKNQALQEAQLGLEREKFAWQKEQAAESSNSSGYGTIEKDSSGSPKSKDPKGKNISAGAKGVANQTYSSYQDAVKALNKAGIEGDGGLMTRYEWSRRKNSGSNKATSAYSSYEEYLTNFVIWRIQNPE